MMAGCNIVSHTQFKSS